MGVVTLPADADLSIIFAAMDQLGLKLQLAKGPPWWIMRRNPPRIKLERSGMGDRRRPPWATPVPARPGPLGWRSSFD